MFSNVSALDSSNPCPVLCGDEQLECKFPIIWIIEEGGTREKNEKDKQNEGIDLDELDEEKENGERDGNREQRENAVQYKKHVLQEAEDMDIIEDREGGGKEKNQGQGQQERQGQRETGEGQEEKERGQE